jgi:hypothetical protein
MTRRYLNIRVAASQCIAFENLLRNLIKILQDVLFYYIITWIR